VIVGPLLGVALYFALFRFLAQAQAITKVVATIGLSVRSRRDRAHLRHQAHPELARPGAAARAGLPRRRRRDHARPGDRLLLRRGGSRVGSYVLRRTQVGLLVRATVDSKAMTSLSGISPARIAVGVWAAGDLPRRAGRRPRRPGAERQLGQQLHGHHRIGVRRGRRGQAAQLPVAVVIGLIMGVVGSLLQWSLPSVSSLVTGDIIAAIPFVMVVIFLLYYTWRKRSPRRPRRNPRQGDFRARRPRRPRATGRPREGSGGR